MARYRLGTRRSLQFQNTSKPLPPWPSGSGGAVVVASGQTFTFVPGTDYNFLSFTAQAGATLLTAQGTSPICVGCLNNFSIDSSLTLPAFLNDETGGTYSRTAPDGTTVSYTIVQSAGGTGGGSSSGGTGPSNFGSGSGGGGGSGDGAPDSLSGGGEGGAGTAGVGPSGGLAGVNNGDGANGSDGASDTETVFAKAQGGSGGGRGFHGQGWYVKIGGQTNCAGSTWDVSGRAGGNGGGGGNATASSVAFSGGGGGGAAGGSGGFVKWRDKGTGTGRPTFVIGGGLAGSGGFQGASNSGDGSQDGNGGINGVVGSTNIGTW